MDGLFPRRLDLRSDYYTSQLMVDAGIKLEDMRHTLPNLKMLLLTLAAQDRPPAI